MHGSTFSRASVADPSGAAGTVYVWGIAIVAALGGLLFGYDWVVIGGARQFYEIYFHLASDAMIGWANSCALVGCLIGSLVAGYLADRFGRRRVLLASAVLFALSSALTGWAHLFTSFIFWRIVGGTAIGLSSNVSPLYIAEISPAAIRGRLVSLNQFAIVVGILLAQIVNWRIARPVVMGLSRDLLLQSWNVQWGWRWMFYAVVVPALIFTIASVFLPESPRWLLARNRQSDALNVLIRIGGDAYAAIEVASIERSLALSADEKSSWSELLRPGMSRIVWIGVAIAVLQQWTGINILFNYAAEVYRRAGYGANDLFLNIVITGAINLIFTVLSMVLVDRVGRRGMMIFGWAGSRGTDAHLRCDCLLCSDSGSGGLGSHRGDLSKSRTFSRRIGSGECSLDSLFPADLYLPRAERKCGHRWNFFHVRDNLPAWAILRHEIRAGNQRQNARTNRG